MMLRRSLWESMSAISGVCQPVQVREERTRRVMMWPELPPPLIIKIANAKYAATLLFVHPRQTELFNHRTT